MIRPHGAPLLPTSGGSKANGSSPTTKNPSMTSSPPGKSAEPFGICHDYYATGKSGRGKDCGHQHLTYETSRGVPIRQCPDASARVSACVAVVRRAAADVNIVGLPTTLRTAFPNPTKYVRSWSPPRVSRAAPRRREQYSVDLFDIDEVKEYGRGDVSSILHHFVATEGRIYMWVDHVMR